jgi:hypothetical protein
VVASGLAAPAAQRLKNGLPLSDDDNLSSSASTTLSVSNLLCSDSASYKVVLTNGFGGAVAVLTVTLPPQCRVAVAELPDCNSCC